MKCSELFKYIKDMPEENWKTSEEKLDWMYEVDHDNKIIRLIFEESDGLRDWFYNFFFHGVFYKKTVYKNQQSEIKAHIGFVTAYKSANDEIMKYIIQEIAQHQDYEVVITGWSHGGAQAQLAAEDLNYRTREDKADPNTGIKPVVVTFGSPKVFVGEECIEYVRSCCKGIIQMAQHNDIVTYMAPFSKFKHLDPNINLKSGRVGEKFSIKKIFKPTKYHTEYDKEELYTPELLSKEL